jgi:outer membrane protein OmpA-like peptidoglycan-associated protein
MFNFTNWVRGYRPGRKYSLVLYGGAGGYWTYSKVYDGTTSKGWKNIHDRVPAFRCGIINSYKVSDQVQLALDIRFIGMDNHPDEESAAWNKTHYVLQGNLGVTYLFKKREWYPPVVPVCPEIPEPENCDAYIARLQAADARIADLEAQLKECQEKPAPKAEVAKPERPDPLATVYFPINVYKLSSKDEKMLRSISEVIKKNPTKKYILTGWADNYTGNDRINTNLRRNRVNSVHKALLSYGVPSSQLSTATDNATLCDLGEKYAALGRAVTIEEAQ